MTLIQQSTGELSPSVEGESPSTAGESPALPYRIPQGDADEFGGLPEFVRNDVLALLEALQRIESASSVNESCKYFAAGLQRSWHRLRALFYAYRKSRDWRVLVNRVRAGLSERDEGLPPAFVEFWKVILEENKRKDKPAWRVLKFIWEHRRHPTSGKVFREIPGYAAWPIADPRTRLPKGWTYSNLRNYGLTFFEKTVARIGRSAAAAHRPLVLMTRADLWVGSHYMIDDLWHDHFVNVLDTKKTGRPLEFGVFDLYSACKFSWGMRVRTENDATGRMEGLKEEMMRYLLASALMEHGYSPRGTILVVEHGTAAVRDDLAKVLHDLSGGKIVVARSGIDGGGDALGLYEGRGKGNFRFKAAYESSHNLTHNEFGALPAQTGRNVESRPEGTHGVLKRNDALLKALIAVEAERPELAKELRFDVCEFGWFLAYAMEVYQRINGRTEHELEGWAANITMEHGRARRLSPSEVWARGRRELIPLSPAAIAMVLGPDLGFERRVSDNVIEVAQKEISCDPLFFDAHALKPDMYRLVLNPFRPDRLFAFDARGGFVAECPRLNRVSRLDPDGLHRACGRVKKIESELLARSRERNGAAIKEHIENLRHNAAVLAGIEPEATMPRISSAATLEDLDDPKVERSDAAAIAEDQLRAFDEL